MSDREVVTAWLMICPKSPRNQDGTAKPPTEEEIRAGLADSLEGYQQVSIGERLRTLDGDQVDTSRWLAPVELAGETDGEPEWDEWGQSTSDVRAPAMSEHQRRLSDEWGTNGVRAPGDEWGQSTNGRMGSEHPICATWTICGAPDLRFACVWQSTDPT